MIEVQYRELRELHQLENNPRIISKDQFESLKTSIKTNPEYFEARPIILSNRTGNLVIIAGNQRYKAAKSLGLEKVPTVLLEGLSELKEKEIIIRDNVSNGSWDTDMLANEWDMEKLDEWGVNLHLNDDLDESDNLEDDWTENQRMRTNYAYNLDLLPSVTLVGKYQMPLIKNCEDVPQDLLGFNYARSSDQTNAFIHFYLDDYQFERIWNSPDENMDVLSKFAGILSPDFSLYLDMPLPMKMWNVYRSRLIGAYAQSLGIKVIPTISWAEPDTYDFCFEGLEQGGIVSVSTIGVKKDKNALKIWRDGMTEMIKRLHPKTIIIYGGKLDFDYGGIETIYFENRVIEKFSRKDK